MNRYEIYKDNENRRWLISTHSYRYDDIKKDKVLEANFDMRSEAFNWFKSKEIQSAVNDINHGFFEIYV